MRQPRRFPSQSAHDMRIKYDQISNHQGLHLCETLSLSVAICCATTFNNLTLLRALGKAGTLAGSLPRFGTSSLSSVLVWSRDGPWSIACVLTDTHNTWHHNTQHVAHNNLLRLGLRKGLNRQERSSMTLTYSDCKPRISAANVWARRVDRAMQDEAGVDGTEKHEVCLCRCRQ